MADAGMASSGRNSSDIVVIGAGLAGLQAAADLVAAGREVTVLEARGRVGGRVWSHHFANGQYCERGAEFVDTQHSEVLALVADLGLSLAEVTSGHDPSRRLLDVGGRAVPFALHHSLGGELAAWERALDDLAARVDPDDPVGGPLAAQLDQAPLSDVIARLGPGALARVAIGREVRTEFMLGPDEISQLFAGWMTALRCYATFGPGQLVEAWPFLQRTYGRMVLAGEHTDAFCGFMEGALRSGRRAAAQVLALT